MDDPHDLERYVRAQQPVFAQVCAELAAGRKQSHWMWFIFPQLAGLGHSAMARRFAIASREEAVAYLGHSVHAGSFGTAEQVLAAGALAALVAAGVQGAIGGRAIRSLRNGTADEAEARGRIATAQRIAAILLAVTAVSMGAARYA